MQKQFNISEVENLLLDEDVEFFTKNEQNYSSAEEEEFFEKMYAKIQTELAPCKELILSEKQNAEEIYILRDQYCEFIVGQGSGDERKEEVHTMSFSEAMTMNLKKQGFLNQDITLQEWLRARNYQGIMYDHNYAYL